MQPTSNVPAGMEEQLLGALPTPALTSVASGNAPANAESEVRTKKHRVPTVPVTFHLPIELRDKIKITAQAKQKTMLEIAVEALQDYLDRNQVSESDLRRLLGL